MMFSMGTYAQTPNILFLNFQAACSETSYIVNELKNTHKERPIAVAQTKEKYLVIFWKSLTTNDFSVTISAEGKNTSCILLEGSDFELVDERGKRLGQPTQLR
jgi:hypothetical protein